MLSNKSFVILRIRVFDRRSGNRTMNIYTLLHNGFECVSERFRIAFIVCIV